MKRILGIAILCFMIMILPVWALDKENDGDIFILEEDEMVNKDVFAAGGYVKILGDINGDLFSIGGKLQNNGHVTGDILSLAGNTYIDGVVDGDIRIGTGKMVISGEVGRNVTALSGDIILEEDAIVDGSFTALAGRVVVDGFVGGDFRSGGSDELLLNGVIKGDVEVGNSNFEFGPEAKIYGSFTYSNESKFQIPPEIVEGEVIHKLPPKEDLDQKDVEEGLKIFNVVKGALSLLSYLIIGTLITLIFKNFMRKSSDSLEGKPWYCIGIGAMGLIITPIASLLVILTVIGIPIGIISLVLYGVFIYLAKLPCALWVGSKILKNEEKPLLPVLLGIIILDLISYIPYLGFFVSLVAVTFGLGSYLINIKEAYQKSKDQKDWLI